MKDLSHFQKSGSFMDFVPHSGIVPFQAKKILYAAAKPFFNGHTSDFP
jgi:hypothetical protein